MKEMADEYGLVYRDYPPYEVLYTKWLSHDDICELKAVEEVLEAYYNSMQYRNTLNYMERFFASPYDMYLKIADFYKCLDDEHGKKYSRQDRYNILFEFFENYCEDGETVENMAQLLTFDIYLRENAKKRPSFSKDIEEYKKDFYALYRKNERDTKFKEQMIHIDIFDIDVIKYQEEGVIEKKKSFVLFNYNNRNYIDNSAGVTEIYPDTEG